MNTHPLRWIVSISLIMVLTGCAVNDSVQQVRDQAVQAVAADWPDIQISPDDSVYALNETESWLRIIVLPDGRLARFGHAHVIGGALSGEIAMRSEQKPGWLDTHIDVNTLEVDRPEWRAAEGFEPELAADAIAGTRSNMLSPGVLDATDFPVIAMRATFRGWNAGSAEVDLFIRLRGQIRRLRVLAPVEFHAGLNEHRQSSSTQMIANGTFVMRQTDFGMQPFSALGGGLSVADELTIRYRIVVDLEPEDVPADPLKLHPVR